MCAEIAVEAGFGAGQRIAIDDANMFCCGKAATENVFQRRAYENIGISGIF